MVKNVYITKNLTSDDDTKNDKKNKISQIKARNRRNRLIKEALNFEINIKT